MNTKTISIQLDDEAAAIYTTASSEQQKKLQMLFSALMREFDSSPASLLSLMDAISDKAQDRGLTPEILDELLHDE
jgi:hypothetical protein